MLCKLKLFFCKYKHWILSLFVSGLLVAVLIALLMPRPPRSRDFYQEPKDIAIQYMNASMDPAFADMVSLFPEWVLDVLFAEQSATDWANTMDNLTLQTNQRMEELYDYWSIRYEIGTEQELSGSTLEEHNAAYFEAYGKEITAAKVFPVQVILNLNGTDKSFPLMLHLVMIDGKWSVDPARSGTVIEIMLPYAG